MNLVASNYTTIDVHQSNGILVTTSRNVAQVFEKNHKDVLRDIRAVLEANPDKVFTERNFAPSEYTDSTGRKLPEYLLTRDGTMLLIMGYTGESAMLFKEAYIQRLAAARGVEQISGIAVNQMLAAKGYQERVNKKWVATEAGIKAGATYLDVGKARSNGTPGHSNEVAY